MLVKIIGTLAICALIALGVLWVIENIRLTKKSKTNRRIKSV